MTAPAEVGPWIGQASCRVRRAVFAASDESALTVCARCPVRVECRAWAMSSPDPAPEMVAGGLTARDRDRLRGGLPIVKWSGRGRRRLAPVVVAVLDLLAERPWLGSPSGWACEPGYDPHGQWWGTGGTPTPAQVSTGDLAPLVADMIALIDERPWLADGDRAQRAPRPGWSPDGVWLGTGWPEDEVNAA